MAAVVVQVNFVDAKNSSSFTRIHIPTGFSLADYLSFGSQFATLIADLSGCAVTSVGLTFSLDLSAATIKATASIVSDVAQKAWFQFRSAVTGLFQRIRFPAFDEGKITAGSDAVSTGNVDVSAVVAAIENGLTVPGGTLAPTDSRENDLVGLKFAREYFRDTT